MQCLMTLIKKNRRNKNTCSGKPPTNLYNFGIGNTGATQKYIRLITPCSNKQPATNAPQVIIPYKSLIQANHTADMNLKPLLTPKSGAYHLLPYPRP